MAKVISIHSFRGGTGRSSVAANVAVQLAQDGSRVGVIDAAMQAPGIHILFGLDEKRVDKALNDYLTGSCAIDDAAYDVGVEVGEGELLLMSSDIYLIPSSIRVADIARVMRDGYEVGLLNDAFRTLTERLDLEYLLIDTHPGLNEETLLSILISDYVFIVLRPDKQDFRGTAVAVDVARKLEVPHIYLVVNMALRSQDHVQLRQQVEEYYGYPVVAILPLSEEVAGTGSAEIFSLHRPDHPFSEGIKHLVGLVKAN